MTSSSERTVPLGEIVGTHGVGGLLRFRPYSVDAAALAATSSVVLSPRRAPDRGAPPPAAAPAQPPASNAVRVLTVRSAHRHGRLQLVRFEGIDRIEDAEPLIGAVVSVAERELPAPGRGEFYAYQLEGLEVITVDGRRLGTVASLFPTGSNEVLVVRDGTREHLIPLIADVVRTIDLGSRRVVIDPINGLLE